MQVAMEVIFEDFDWDELHEAKRVLVSNIWQQPDSKLWKVVDVINGLQQSAIENDLWAFPASDKDVSKVVRKSDVLSMELREGDLCWDSNRAVGMEWRGGEWEDIPYSDWVARHSERS